MYSIFINKKEIQVSYLIFICHCFKELKTLQTLDEYALLGSKECFDRTSDILNYLNTLHSFSNETPIKFSAKTITILKTSIFKSSIVFLALFYREFKYVLEGFKTKKQADLYSDIKLDFKILNKVINYPSINTSESYNNLQPWLNFYWKIAITNQDNFISVSSIEKVIKKIDPVVSLKDIQEDLNNHLIIIPYKDYYIWSSDCIHKWLTTESRSVIQSCIYNKRLSMRKINFINI